MAAARKSNRGSSTATKNRTRTTVNKPRAKNKSTAMARVTTSPKRKYNRYTGAKSNPVRRRRRRNPGFLGGGMVKSLLLAGGGAALTRLGAGYLPFATTGLLGIGIQLGIALVLKFVAGKFMPAPDALLVGVGGAAGAVADGISLILSDIPKLTTGFFSVPASTQAVQATGAAPAGLMPAPAGMSDPNYFMDGWGTGDIVAQPDWMGVGDIVEEPVWMQ